MNGNTDWAMLGKEAQARAEAEAPKQAEFAKDAERARLEREAFRQKALSALQQLRNICERNCEEYNTHVSGAAHRVSVKDTTDGFSIEKGNGIVHAYFKLDRLDSKTLTSSRENSMTPRNQQFTKFDVVELDGIVHFGKMLTDFIASDTEDIAEEACKWVIGTEEAYPNFKTL